MRTGHACPPAASLTLSNPGDTAAGLERETISTASTCANGLFLLQAARFAALKKVAAQRQTLAGGAGNSSGRMRPGWSAP